MTLWHTDLECGVPLRTCRMALGVVLQWPAVPNRRSGPPIRVAQTVDHSSCASGLSVVPGNPARSPLQGAGEAIVQYRI